MTEAKRGRGRPRIHDAEGLRVMRSLYPEIHTERQLQNLRFAFRALTILELMPSRDGDSGAVSNPQPTWLADWDGANRGKQGAIKWSILEQLGRMADAGLGDKNIRRFATEIEQLRLSAKEGAARLREMRMEVMVMVRS